MIRDLVSFIKAVEQIASQDVSALLHVDGDTSILTSSCSEFFSTATEEQLSLLEEIEGTAGEHLTTDTGQLCDYAKAQLKKKGVEIIRLSMLSKPVYGLKLKEYVIPLCLE